MTSPKTYKLPKFDKYKTAAVAERTIYAAVQALVCIQTRDDDPLVSEAMALLEQANGKIGDYMGDKRVTLCALSDCYELPAACCPACQDHHRAGPGPGRGCFTPGG